MTKKTEIIKDLKFCQTLMNRLVDYANKNYKDSPSWASKHTVVQADIVRLRRELNEIRQKLDWNYNWNND